MSEVVTTEKQKEEVGRWTAEKAITYLLNHGAKPARQLGYPVIELPTVAGLKTLGAIDYLKKKHGVKQMTYWGAKYLWSLGRVLHFVTSR